MPRGITVKQSQVYSLLPPGTSLRFCRAKEGSFSTPTARRSSSNFNFALPEFLEHNITLSKSLRAGANLIGDILIVLSTYQRPNGVYIPVQSSTSPVDRCLVA